MSKITSESGKKKIRAIVKKGPKKQSQLLQDFITEFYSHSSEDYLSLYSYEHLYKAGSGLWEFISGKKKGVLRKVRVYNPTIETHGWHSERTILETCVQDSPFILDSITAELARHGLNTYEIIHPILHLKRNKKGDITTLFSDAQEKDASGTCESVMHFEITHVSDEKILKTLEADVENVLSAVQLAISDWPEMRRRIQGIAASLETSDLPVTSGHLYEVQDFLGWLLDDNFILLGCREYNFVGAKGKEALSYKEKADLGVFRLEGERKPVGLTALPSRAGDSQKYPVLLEISKSSRKSIVHRPVHMDYISVKTCNKDGAIIGEHRILGLFTSSVYFQSATVIPLIRDKITSLVMRTGFQPDSHNGKAIRTILENYPRDELFQISDDELYRISMGILSLMERPRTKLFIRKDAFSEFVSCLVFVPRDRFNTQIRMKIQGVLEAAFDGIVTDHYLQVTESRLVRVHFILRADTKKKVSNVAIEKKLIEITNSWVDGLRDILINHKGEKKGEKVFNSYVDAFTEPYKEHYTIEDTYADICHIEEALEKNDLTLNLYKEKGAKGNGHSYQLKIFHPKTQVTLSEILPILENMGFHGMDELIFCVTPEKAPEGVWVHHFGLKLSRTSMDAEDTLTIEDYKAGFEEALAKIWHHDIENDALNKLIIRINMSWREVVLIRAFVKYIQQTAFAYSQDFMSSVIARHPGLTKQLLCLFMARFDPNTKGKRKSKIKTLIQDVEKRLAAVSDVAEDRVIRQLFDTILATVRTNYFQKDKDGNPKSYISFKFDSSKIPNLPKPVPYAEIFVYSRDVEGIHLRGGKVARGGLRWSDRKEDFRTEVLGLVKAQIVKNTVIVPVGSKGGFVVKHPVREGGREAAIQQGIACYKTFLSGLLDITDNIIEGTIVPPKDTVRQDGDDPYLVVAADKGTATFSDIANEVSESYGFWLGDAFASGGSAGYDHKKMGITAKGAWISVIRHFQEMGINCQEEDFTAVGVGDMSGDVFGNGMLLSKHTRLLAAFNHLHIFIDPNPDAVKSYKERERLFKKARSSWTDYDTKLISKGGGVFDRSAKSIRLSAQIRKCFGIDEKELSPDELIKHILKGEYDLLWNGGIGTYVKAETESHEEVGDKANDPVRLNGKELRCKIVGEGGNLGLTQRGRIEYAMNGGRINTDAIDNSAGVDCSDHEVNIKIALHKALESKKLSAKARNRLLSDMTDEVTELVLRDNLLQTQVISLIEQQGAQVIDAHIRLMHVLEQLGELDRQVEFLPDDEALINRRMLGNGISRPEISVLLAYSKLSIHTNLLESNMPDDNYFYHDLMMYFPETMHKKFKNEIEDHELKREIIVTSVTNSIVNRMGCTFFHRVMDNTGVKGCDVARSYIAVRDSFGLRELWSEIEALDGKISVEAQAKLLLAIQHLIERNSYWFLRHMPQPLKVSDMVRDFSEGVKKLDASLEKIMSPSITRACKRKLDKYLAMGVPKALAEKVARLEALGAACDIIHVAQKGHLPLTTVGEIYYALGGRLSLGWMRVHAWKISATSVWNRLSVQMLSEAFSDQQMRLTAEVIKVACKGSDCSIALDTWYEKNDKELSRYDQFIEELQRQENVDLSMLIIAERRIEGISAL